jgi:N-acetylmuramoyl-L-alanine amidase
MLIAERHLSQNRFSRPGTPIDPIKSIIVHYVGNPGQSADRVRDYFDGLKTQDAADAKPDRSASAHYVVGLRGEIIQCIPENEVAYHCGAANYTPWAREYFGEYCTNPRKSPNLCTLGIELCHKPTNGQLSIVTLSACRELIRDICRRHNFNTPRNVVFRHYDITGKDCPRWFVAHPEDWQSFIDSI